MKDFEKYFMFPKRTFEKYPVEASKEISDVTMISIINSAIHDTKKEEALFKKKQIALIVFEALKEIHHPSFGGSRLINELKKDLEKRQSKVSIVSLHEINSISSKFLRIEKNGRQKTVKTIKKRLENERINWALSLFVSLFGEFLTRLDFVFSIRIRKRIERIRPSVVIYNGSIGALALLKICKKLNTPLIVCEHNIDYYFLSEKINSRWFHPLVRLYKFIEVTVARKTDLVLCFNENDKEKLIHERVPHFRIIVWRFKIQPRIYDEKRVINSLPNEIKNRLKNRPVVCFLGANYSVNAITVQKIFQIARRIPGAVFLITGSVGERFRGTTDHPENVIFSGYVEDIMPYLAVADILLNLKLTSDTGIEAKMFDYLKFNKPIISTRMGTSGFESCENVIFVDTPEEAIIKIQELTDHSKRVFG